MRATPFRGTLLMLVGSACMGISSAANAFHVEMRWIERTGTIDHVIGGDGAVATFAPGTSHRIRMQFGVFDDAESEAPEGGFIGWNMGTLSTTGGINRRTPGRLSPFNFAPNPPGNGLPTADPFTMLTAIDNTLGLQQPNWLCDGNQHPLPMPLPIIRGRNTFVSIFEFTTIPGTENYLVTAAGRQLIASGWGIIGTPVPPDCVDIEGYVTYAPIVLPPILLSSTLTIIVPGPASGALLLAPCLLGRRRRIRGPL